jgi:hypothetical protein
MHENLRYVKLTDESHVDSCCEGSSASPGFAEVLAIEAPGERRQLVPGARRRHEVAMATDAGQPRASIGVISFGRRARHLERRDALGHAPLLRSWP